MKFLITISILLSSFVFASEVRFNCNSNNEAIKLQGTLSIENAKVKIYDQQDLLGIKELSVGEVVTFERWLRKKEDKYSFAKLYSDFNAWQGIELSLPKAILEGTEKGLFSAFLTVYVDDGDRMVPGESNKLSCRTK